MISLLAKLFIKDHNNMGDNRVRGAYGSLCSIVGILLNILLFIGKYAAGFISGSIAVTADAFNNLSDAGSSLITLIGFKLSGKDPDSQHPFGHGRMEYITGFVVSVIIMLMGFELASSSLDKILHPTPVDASVLSFIILLASIGVKAYMAIYNRSVGKQIHSPAMRATAADSLSDAVATSVVLIATLVQQFAGIEIDGWCGIAVSIFIFRAGILAAKDTLSPLLGQPPEEEFVGQIKSIVLAHKEIIGMHDLIVHDYGPGRVMITLHGEVDRRGDISHLHDVIDVTERELKEKLGCTAVIHMDPVAVDDENVIRYKRIITERLAELGTNLSIHDFRIVPGPSHTNVIFDVCIPYGFNLSDEEVTAKLSGFVSELGKNFYAVITIDRIYV